MTGAVGWVDTMQPDPQTAAAFYGALLGWEFDADGDYVTARVGGRRVAGIGRAPSAFWATYVQVETLEETLERAVSAGGSVAVAPIDVGGGRAAAIADPSGVPLGLREGPGFELTGEPGAWAMSALHSPDPDGAQRFFADLFGWEAEPTPGSPLVRWRLNGDVVAVMTPTEGGVPPHWAVNFRVADVDAVSARATELGGTVLLGPIEAQNLRNAAIADPQGGVIAISAPAVP